MANGMKIGEVTQTAAMVWTRLTGTRACERTDFTIPGCNGRVRLRYGRKEDGSGSFETEWIDVDPKRDHTHAFELSGLDPGTEYSVEVQAGPGRGDRITSTLTGSFRTAPASDDTDKVLFTVVTGQNFHHRDHDTNGHMIYPSMLALDPDFFVHTGDIVYYDKPDPKAQNIGQARAHWHRMYSLPYQRSFHSRVGAYFIKDDHDAWCNDCWPGMKNKGMGEFTFEQGKAVFLEQVPMRGKTYRTVRWGKDLQIWLVEGRDYRTPNSMPDGWDKTIWGKEQVAWFMESVNRSDATFRVLITPTPVVGPDRKNKNDNHANAGFEREGSLLRRFMASQKNMVVVCGDRHWQYVSEDPDTSLMEFSCGPASDCHAGGWDAADKRPMHRYLRVKGGFLSGTVERVNGEPELCIRHHAVDGTVHHEERLRGG